MSGETSASGARDILRVVCDVDGVWADTAGQTYRDVGLESWLELVEHHSKLFDVLDSQVQGGAQLALQRWARAEWWGSIPPIETGITTALDVILRYAEVSIATSPYEGGEDWWKKTRSGWLRRLVGSRLDTIPLYFESQKAGLAGDVLIEDNMDTALDWAASRDDRLAIVIDRPWNRYYNSKGFGINERVYRVGTFREAAYLVYVWCLGRKRDPRAPDRRLANKKYARPREGDILIGRPMPLANPYVVGLDGDRDRVLAKYASHFDNKLETDRGFARHVDESARVAHDHGRFMCFCVPDRCHGEIVLDHHDRAARRRSGT